jgi:predicted nucleotide-binding protein
MEWDAHDSNAPFPVEVVPIGGGFAVVDLVVPWLNGVQSELRFHRPQRSFKVLRETPEPCTPSVVWERLEKYRNTARTHLPFIIAVTPERLHHTRYDYTTAAYDVGAGLAVVSMSGWEEAAKELVHGEDERSRAGLLAYYLIRLTIRLICPELLEHDDDDGDLTCMFQVRPSLGDLLQALSTISICAKCLETIADEIAPDVVASIQDTLGRIKRSDFPLLTKKLWIAHSEKGEDVARYLYQALDTHISSRFRVECDFSNYTKELSRSILESIADKVRHDHYAVLVLTPDDALGEDRAQRSPSSDILFMLGFFMGTLGQRKTFMIQQSGAQLRLPDYVSHLPHAEYRLREDDGTPDLNSCVIAIRKALQESLG